MKELDVSRITAKKYLGELVRIGLLKKHKIGRDNYYVNFNLYDLLANISQK